MEFSLEKSIEILKQTPITLTHLLSELSESWIRCTEGNETWSPYTILGHLIYLEKTDWMPRVKLILSGNEKSPNTFNPVDRFAQLKEDQNVPIQRLLTDFLTLRNENIEHLSSLHLSETDFSKIAFHPALGKVRLKQLLSTWAVHDLGHIAQICRVLAHQYHEEVGPWKQYLPIVKNK